MSRIVILSWQASAGQAMGRQCVRNHHPLRLRAVTLGCSHCCLSRLGRHKSTTSNDVGEVVTIGDVSKRTRRPKHPELVPTKYLPDPIPQNLLKQLRWIMQKDLLGQDVFLIGPPGPLRRTIAMMYLELTRREVEYVSLSRDTTEMDLKQRREIRSNSAFHIDQSAVKAALEGRVLVLEGIEKAERNVLPVLNNLLENREMQLDDGRFLMAADRYDKLLKDHSQEELDVWKLVRVSEHFRVIALGLPVPRYQGNPLDPPLRSRFQALNVDPLPFKDHLEVLNAIGHGVPVDRLSQILSFALTLKSDEAKSLGLPDFPLDNLHAIIKILTAVPSVSTQRLLQRLYPYDTMLGKEGQTAVLDALKSFNLLDDDASYEGCLITEVRLTGDDRATVQVKHGHHTHELHVAAGTSLAPSSASGHYVNTHYHDQLLADMMESHMVKDFCIIGPRGCGKSVIAHQFAELLGYHTEPIMLYQDMGARDLLQQRITLTSGDTAWQPSPLVKAALDGSIALLDGVHRINPGTFAVLHRLIHDRELSLFDGSKLLRHDRYVKIKDENKLTDEDMTSRGVFKIHPSFRIVALSEPHVADSSSQQWLNSEQLTMFLYHNMRPLSWAEELDVIHKLVPGTYDIEPIMKLTHRLRESHDSNLMSLASSLSTRQLLRIARRMAKYPRENMYETVHKACLARFLPRLTRNALEEELKALGINKPELPSSTGDAESSTTCGITDGVLRIGSTEMAVYDTESKMKVPDVLFYDNHQHMVVMEDMLKDFILGEHLLLIGNQGVGKNKIADRFLSLLNRPREYLQLHRDTTVQTLTLQPTVRDGVIVYEDSPLVRAVKTGHILVVDEADKAPTNVTCILKTLVESGEMHLADGRKIIKGESDTTSSDSVIRMHPDFQMLVLANRPGFPFLGNDFFSAMGDVFSTHAVNNPDIESEMAMLRNYGPDVPEEILRKLVLAFSELRDLADQGLITYPYSTREVVNMVRHLQKFPNEGLVSVVRNVFDFDSYNPEVTNTVIGTLHKHGIPIGADPRNIHLSKEFPMPGFKFAGQWRVHGSTDHKNARCPVEEKQLRVKDPVTLRVETFTQDKTDARSVSFSEQEAYWTLPLHETSVVTDVAVTKATGPSERDVIHVATINPISLYTIDMKQRHVSCIDLYSMFPSSRGGAFRSRIQLAPLSSPHSVVVHEATSNTVVNVNWQTGEVDRIDSSSLLEAAAEKLIKNFRHSQGRFEMCSEFSRDQGGMILFYKVNSQTIEVVHLTANRCRSVQLPMKIGSVLMMSKEDWLITEAGSDRKFILHHDEADDVKYIIRPVEDTTEDLGKVEFCASEQLHDSLLSAAIQQQTSGPNRVLATRGSYATVAVGLPESDKVEFHTAVRETAPTKARVGSHVIYLPDSGQVIRALPTDDAPKDVYPQGVRPKNLCGYLEVCDLVNGRLRYLPVPAASVARSSMYWLRQSASEVSFVTAATSNDGLVTVDGSGCVRLWETALSHIQRSIGKWRGLIGEGDTGHLQLTVDRDLGGKQATAPKHGRVDPTGDPHVGGNTWAGGTGGRDTAGLGGIGGPYRLDAGHTVHQVSDAEKAAVPEEVKRAAREMGQKAFKQRLREIEMSEYDASVYEKFSGNVQSQVKSIRIMLDSLQAKGKERQWMRNQTHGDLDEARLIEGLAGEKAIYRRRGEKEPEMGSPQQKPKMMQIVCDVSGSMYRFNGHDGRLMREMEAMAMFMEALENYEQKIKYSIVGHSGEGFKFDFVKVNNPPKNNKERLMVLETLHAHSQFCLSGDHTLDATRHAIETIVTEDADEHFVIVLSDANFDRYGIPPRRFADILTANEDVNAYVIFIGSLGDQAQVLMNKMPSGRAFLCMDTKDLPQILQQIFTSTMLK